MNRFVYLWVHIFLEYFTFLEILQEKNKARLQGQGPFCWSFLSTVYQFRSNNLHIINVYVYIGEGVWV